MEFDVTTLGVVIGMMVLANRCFNAPKGWYLFLTKDSETAVKDEFNGFNAPKGWYLFLTT